MRLAAWVRTTLAWGFAAGCALWMAEQGWSAEGTPSPPPRELMAQIVNIDREDFKAKGRITLHRLQPLAGQLVLTEAKGDPEWIFKTIAPWNPGLAGFLRDLKIRELTLADADLLLDGPKTQLEVAQAAIPEGRIQQVAYQQESGGGWRVTTAAMRLDRLPQGLSSLLMPLSGGVGVERLQAEGDREQGQGMASGVFGPGWRVARLEGAGAVTGRDGRGRPVTGQFSWNGVDAVLSGLQQAVRQVPQLADLLRFAGQDPKSTEPVALSKVTTRVESDGQGRFVLRTVQVDAPWVRLSGEGTLQMRRADQGEPMLRLNLLAKNRQGQERRFKIHIPISAWGAS
ncbi:MAG: hypothetical protein G8237_14140 [Magnetococcales bacterium]|nr:hypothetical protein [Magnetococcales bacterium]